MVHAWWHDAIAGHIEIGAQHFVSMTFDTAENGYANSSSDVPQAHRMVLAGRQQQVWFVRMEFQFVDGMTVTNEIPMTSHIGYIEYADNAAVAGSR